MLAKWNKKPNCLELFAELTLLGLPCTGKCSLWNTAKMPNPRLKLNSTLARSFQQKPCSEMDFMPNLNFVLSCNNKDQLGELYNYLNQKVIITINTLDGSALRDNLITSHQIDYMCSVLIPAEAVKNHQEHLVALW